MARLLGTAGHVDHGKTALIKALTGTDTDRLPEEARRGMTIDIGFARLRLPGGAEASVVDVPGHERFLANMLVGVLGTDAALLCVALDEGVMPQTREHVAILDLLPVSRLVVALTKSDLSDPAMQEIVQEEVAELLEGTRFAGSEAVPVSSTTGDGLDALRAALSRALSSEEARAPGPWYMPVDRVFSVKGHGTVVTGTMMRGRVEAGVAAALEPGGHAVRVRSLQYHGSDHPAAEAGQRTGANLAGVRREQVWRGQVLGEPGAVVSTRALDAEVRWVAEARHGRRVRVSIGADEAVARLVLKPGAPGLARLRFEREVAAVRGQPLVVRDYSPPKLLGGGTVVRPAAAGRLQPARAGATPEEALLAALDRSPEGLPAASAAAAAGLAEAEAGPVFDHLVESGRALGLAGQWFSAEGFEAGCRRLLEALDGLHSSEPARAWFPRSEALQRAGLRWGGRTLDRAVAHLAGQGALRSSGSEVSLPGRSPALNERQRRLLDAVRAALDAQGASVPGTAALADAMGLPRQAVESTFATGLQAGELVRLAEGLVYTREGIARIEAAAREALGQASFTVSEFRGALGTSRKYAVPLLEYFDRTGATLRQGETRVFR